jgi:hypothetical protein
MFEEFFEGLLEGFERLGTDAGAATNILVRDALIAFLDAAADGP